MVKEIVLMVMMVSWMQCSPPQHLPKVATRLKLDEHEVFQLKGNEFFLDSLILANGSKLLLDTRYNTTTLRVNFLSIGNNCSIFGVGKQGADGQDMIPENNLQGRTNMGVGGTLIGKGIDPRTNTMPEPGVPGKRGQTGSSGVNLNFYCRDIDAGGTLTVDLSGGNGGLGGLYTLSQQTTVIKSGRAQAGAGGDGGDFIISFPEKFEKTIANLITVHNPGGFSGERSDSKNKDAAPKRIQASGGKVKFIALKD